MPLPQGFQHHGTGNVVCKLQKSLYGLKQASCQWFAKLSSKLLGIGYHQSMADYSLFTKTANNSLTIIHVYALVHVIILRRFKT